MRCMELTEALVTEDITPFERERLREALEEEVRRQPRPSLTPCLPRWHVDNGAFIAARISESSTAVGSGADDQAALPFFVVIIKDPLLQQEPFARPYQLIFYTLRIDDRA
jgi:hypothetical protein